MPRFLATRFLRCALKRTVCIKSDKFACAFTSLKYKMSTDNESLSYLKGEDAQNLDKDLMDTKQHAFSVDTLMELAGLSVAQSVYDYYGKSFKDNSCIKTLILCGSGFFFLGVANLQITVFRNKKNKNNKTKQKKKETMAVMVWLLHVI